jgi:hypothetical protein
VVEITTLFTKPGCTLHAITLTTQGKVTHVQVFLPWPSFDDTAKSLDKQRLQKQLVEAYQITRCATGTATGWSQHPAVKLWSPHVIALRDYTWSLTLEWNSRGGLGQTCADGCDFEIGRHERHNPKAFHDGNAWRVPPATGFAPFHVSHQLNLMRKNHDWYAPQFDSHNRIPMELLLTEPYLWPVGDNYFQVGQRGIGVAWESTFGVTTQRDRTLIVTRTQAWSRYQRDYPILLGAVSHRCRCAGLA